MKKETKKDKKRRLQTVADTLQAEVARYRLVRQEWEARYHRLEASAAAASPHTDLQENRYDTTVWVQW
jgi:hypothetical protein